MKETLARLIKKNYGAYEAPRSFDFPKVSQPKVSLIIPVYNKCQMTKNCLWSILKHTKNVSYEILIADDCSTDETKYITNDIKGIQHVRTKRNLGFGGNVENAATHAKGEYICFLNNDMLFYDNWLTAIIDVLDNDDSIGAAGGTLLAPDGRVSELGGIVAAENMALRIGRGCKYKSRLRQLNDYDFDYKSGCLLVLRRSLWEELDGFDKELRPAYYEDADLCFRIHKKGLKVVNVFESKVMHFETISYGDKEMNQSEISQKNGKYFYQKWANVLDDEDHRCFVENLLRQEAEYLCNEKHHQFCYKEKMPNGRRHVYILGMKVLSYKKKRKSEKPLVIPKTHLGSNKIVIYTCITGNYDDLIQHTCVNKNYDYVLFTDNQEYIAQKQVGIWQVRPLAFTKGTLSEINRWHKFHPHLLFPEYEESVYIDANINVKTKKLFEDIEALPKETILSVPKHYKRDCIYDEIEAVAHYELETPENLKKHLQFLEKERFPHHYGLGENNVIYRKHHDGKCIRLMDDWWDILNKYSKRDQLSLFYVLWKNKVDIVYLSMLNYRTDTENFEFRAHLVAPKKVFKSEV